MLIKFFTLISILTTCVSIYGMENHELFDIVRKGDGYSLEKILKKSPHVNFLDSDGNTPLMKAMTIKNWYADYFVNMLIAAGADLKIKNKKNKTALRLATNHKVDIIKILVASGAPTGGFESMANL